MGYVGDKIIVQTGKFPLDGKIPENNENGDSDTDDHNDADDKNADFRGID